MVLFGFMCINVVTTKDERHIKTNNMRKITLLLKKKKAFTSPLISKENYENAI